MPKRERSLSEFIRDYLTENGEAYVKQLKDEYEGYCERMDYPAPSYDSVRSTVWELKQLGLIRPSRTEGTPGGISDRQYYRLSPGARSGDWSDPRGQLYPRDE